MKNNRILTVSLNNMPLILFIAVFAFFGILTPRFFTATNVWNILTSASYIGIIAVGMTFVLLTGGIDLSVGSTMYVSGIAAGLLLGQTHAPLWLALLCCLGCGILIGAINAFFIVKCRLLPFVVTLSTMIALRGFGLWITRSIAVPFPEAVTNMATMRLGSLVPLPIVVFAVVVFAAWFLLSKTPLGRTIYAVGHDARAAKKAGLGVNGVVWTVYIASGAMAALGGFISVAQLGIINAGFGKGDEFDAIAAAVLGGASLFGGIGTVFPGTVLGTIMIQMVQAGLVFAGVDLYIQPMCMAVILFLTVYVDSVRTRHLQKMGRRTIMKVTER